VRWTLGRSTEEALGPLRVLADHSSAVAVFDRELRYLAATRRWVDDHRLTGAPIGRSHYDVFPETPDAQREIHRRARRGETIRGEGWEVRPWRTETGEIGGIVMSTDDLATARRARDEYRHLFEISEAGNAEAEIPSGRFVRVNAAFCLTLGYPSDEL